MRHALSQKSALVVFIVLLVFIIGQGTWWVVFMAQLVDEKVDIAAQLGGDPAFVEAIHEQEIARQIMLGLEGSIFLIVLMIGIWLIYRALVKTEQLKRNQQNFLMAVTHELKTPLASMKVYLDSLQSDKIPPEKKQAIFPRVKNDVTRLENMVENILEAGRIGRAAYRLNRERVNFSDLVHQAADRAQHAVVRVPVKLSREIEEGVCIHGDPAVLKRAVDAVLDNALKYHDDRQVTIDVRLAADSKRAVLTIADQGVGLERQEYEAVFDRFYRVGNELTRTTQGTGLGLYLCREMIQGHGGTVVARSDGLQKGTRFVITLPLEDCK
jgi:signal transduction histidine kinase